VRKRRAGPLIILGALRDLTRILRISRYHAAVARPRRASSIFTIPVGAGGKQ